MADSKTPKTPFWKQGWFWVLVVLVIAIAGGAIASHNDGGKSADAPKVVTSQSGKTVKAPVTKEDKKALNSAEALVDHMHLSRKGVYTQLTKQGGEGFSKAAANYAVKHVHANWNKNALMRGKQAATSMHLSKQKVYDQLTSTGGDQFKKTEAQYAIDHLHVNWKHNALSRAQHYHGQAHMTNAAIQEQLTSPSEKFTKEEAEYALKHL
jgi:hypothetical protein